MTTETWRPVLGYEGIYEVSDLGSVRSLDRLDARPALVDHRRQITQFASTFGAIG